MMALVVAKTAALVGASAVPGTHLPIDRTVDFLLAEHRGSVPEAFLSTPETQAETTPGMLSTQQVSTDAGTLKERAQRAMEIGDSLATALLAKLAIAMNPEDANSYVHLGAACDRLGMHEKAKAAYEACARNASAGPTDVCHALVGPTK
jgi:tetratricopeptide (TPR) repeat protein